MSEIVVAGSAQIGAAGAIVVRIARYPKLVHHFRILRFLLLLGPLGVHLQPLLHRKSTNQLTSANVHAYKHK